jgi:hypothetical protein
VGDTLSVDIRGTGRTYVRVHHLDDRKLTIQTQEGHPEAGRISFAAETGPHGSLVLKIRSRARSAGPIKHLMYLLAGKRVQTRVWTTYLERLARACGGRPEGPVQVEESADVDRAADRGETAEPTLVESPRP